MRTFVTFSLAAGAFVVALTLVLVGLAATVLGLLVVAAVSNAVPFNAE